MEHEKHQVIIVGGSAGLMTNNPALKAIINANLELGCQVVVIDDLKDVVKSLHSKEMEILPPSLKITRNNAQVKSFEKSKSKFHS